MKHNILHLGWLIFLGMWLWACTPQPQHPSPTTEETTSSNTPDNIDTPDSLDVPNERKVDTPIAHGIEATYQSCTVYAGSTDYYFDKGGEQIHVRVSHLPDEKTRKHVILPENMLEDTKEGPPGPNPALVGKKFVLIYDENGEISEIRKKGE